MDNGLSCLVTLNVPEDYFANNLPQLLNAKNHHTFFIKVLNSCTNEIENDKIA